MNWLPAICILLASAAPAQSPTTAQAEHDIIERSNAFRRSQGLAPVMPNATLTAAARAFAGYMARTGQYGHEADGHTPAQRAQAQGYAWCLVAENLAYLKSNVRFGGEEIAQRFVQGWIDSPGHRHNLLDEDATEIGVAVVQGAGQGTTFAVQMFGRPVALKTKFEISNGSGRTVNYRLGNDRFTLPPRVIRDHEQCRADALVVDLPGKPPTTLAPDNGAKYRVEEGSGGLRLVRR
jgi:uncharacterized protein YkwD